jgi:hypothetical protein
VVDRVAVTDGEDLVGLDVAEHGDLGLDTLIQSSLFATAGNEIGGETQTTKVTDGSLGRLGLLLADGTDGGDQGNVDQGKVIVADTELELTHGLNKGSGLDITDGTSELDDADIGLLARVVNGDGGNTLDPVLDGIGNVRDDLNGLTEVVSLALTLDDIPVDLAGGDVVGAGQSNVKVTLVVSEIEIDLTTIVQDKDLTYDE